MFSDGASNRRLKKINAMPTDCNIAGVAVHAFNRKTKVFLKACARMVSKRPIYTESPFPVFRPHILCVARKFREAKTENFVIRSFGFECSICFSKNISTIEITYK